MVTISRVSRVMVFCLDLSQILPLSTCMLMPTDALFSFVAESLGSTTWISFVFGVSWRVWNRNAPKSFVSQLMIFTLYP